MIARRPALVVRATGPADAMATVDLARKLGPACDNLVAAVVVTGDGRLVIADELQNTDLLWALCRGRQRTGTPMMHACSR